MEEFTCDHFRRAAEDMLRHAGQVLPSTQEREDRKRIMVIQEPVGVVAAISPWNFPVDIAGIPIVYGLAAGCTVVWKPSEYAPLCAELFVDLLHDAGFPPGTVNLVHGRGDVGRELVRTRAWPRSSSPARSRRASRSRATPVSRTACSSWAATARRSCCADADLDRAADAAIIGCFYLAGQCCTAAERILVHDSVNDPFIEELLARTRDAARGRSRSTRRPTWARSARRRAASARRSTSPTPSRRAPGRLRRRPRRPVPRADRDRRRHAATCASRRRRRSGRSRRS